MRSQLSAFDQLLQHLQHAAFSYFRHEANPGNGLILDKTAPNWPASIAATGLALASYPVAIEQGFISRAEGIQRTLSTLRFFRDSEQSEAADATGFRGFYYHFLDMQTGKRVWNCELSTVDSAFLFAGMLTAAQYFADDTPEQREIRDLADMLYRRADWQWALTGSKTLCHGWKPESGFLKFSWEGYNEGLLLYLLALGSPTFPLPRSAYDAWCSTYEWKQCYDIDYLYAGPLFIHQLSHVWVDFRGIQDDFMRSKGIDYFENSRRATHVQQRYAIDNPKGFVGYDHYCWGITASDGPGPATSKVNGVKRRFYDYEGRGIPYGIDDGTLAPWAVVASLPFAQDIVEPAIHHYMRHLKLHENNPYGFRATFNASFPGKPGTIGWISPWHFGLNQGPIALMIENHRTGKVWELMRSCDYLVTGLRRAGFDGGWLNVDSAGRS